MRYTRRCVYRRRSHHHRRRCCRRRRCWYRRQCLRSFKKLFVVREHYLIFFRFRFLTWFVSRVSVCVYMTCEKPSKASNTHPAFKSKNQISIMFDTKEKALHSKRSSTFLEAFRSCFQEIYIHIYLFCSASSLFFSLFERIFKYWTLVRICCWVFFCQCNLHV